MFGLEVAAVVIALALMGALTQRSKNRALLSAPAGSTRVEVVKARAVGALVSQYAEAGWSPVSQTSAKSFGSQARVTIGFQKATN